MSATSVKRLDTKARSAKSEQALTQPKYLESSVWMDAETSPTFSLTACCMLTDEPLPQPSCNEFNNTDVMNTICDNPQLFQIVTPIEVEKFEVLLDSHPNKPFMQSVGTSPCEGFWPWVDTQREEYLVTLGFPTTENRVPS